MLPGKSRLSRNREMNAPIIAANPVNARRPFNRKILAVVVGALLLVAGVLAWSLEGWGNVWRAERDDVAVAHRAVLAWCARNHQAPNFSVFDRMGRPRALRALELLEQDRRIGISDRIWAHAAVGWCDSRFAGVSDRLNLWLCERGEKVLSNFSVDAEAARKFRLLTAEHFAEASPAAK
jgi:hypothetical protein